jgi:hypothetical protein
LALAKGKNNKACFPPVGAGGSELLFFLGWVKWRSRIGASALIQSVRSPELKNNKEEK